LLGKYHILYELDKLKGCSGNNVNLATDKNQHFYIAKVFSDDHQSKNEVDSYAFRKQINLKRLMY
jgi:hypothetical protein